MSVTRAAKTAVLFAATAVGTTSIVARALAQGPQLSPPLFKDLKWRSIGPAIFGGRILDIEVARVRGQPDQLYLIAENGGVFKSVGGTARNHLSSIMQKLGAHSRLEAIRAAEDKGWL